MTLNGLEVGETFTCSRVFFLHTSLTGYGIDITGSDILLDGFDRWHNQYEGYEDFSLDSLFCVYHIFGL